MPLIVFFAIGAGTIISKRSTNSAKWSCSGIDNP
jgi:hypothetical protein